MVLDDDGGLRNVLLPEGKGFAVSGEDGDRMSARLNGKDVKLSI